MTDRLAKLVALKEAVKAGEWVTAGDGTDTWLIVFDAGLRPHHDNIKAAFHDDNEAALALLAALLPEWVIWNAQKSVFGYEAGITNGPLSSNGVSKISIARALVLAILSALIERERQP